MKTLTKQIQTLRRRLSIEQRQELSDNKFKRLLNVYPFNKFECALSHLISCGIIDFHKYQKIRQEYIDRNRYLYLFEMSPRAFGQTWGEQHLKSFFDELKNPSSFDDNYDGEYDLWLAPDIKIEVKASRAVSTQRGTPLVEKALLHSENSNRKFLMNFQQLKPKCCDIFVWIAVWKDQLDYWVIPARDIFDIENFVEGAHFSSQHRTKNNELWEGQIIMTNSNYNNFAKYKVDGNKIIEKIRELNLEK